MTALPPTTTILLDRLLREDDVEVWSELDRRYRPVLLGLARRTGLSREDAEDAAQETMLRFSRAYRKGGYEREKGRLRSWLLAIARRCFLDIREARMKRHELRGQSALADVLDENTLEELWEAEYKSFIKERALHELRAESRIDDKTIRAFERFVFEEHPAAEVAAELGMSADSVYAAKHRCTRRLREIVDELRRIYDFG